MARGAWRGRRAVGGRQPQLLCPGAAGWHAPGVQHPACQRQAPSPPVPCTAGCGRPRALLSRAARHARREECEERGATIIYATHIFDGLEGWITHMAYLEGGKMQVGERWHGWRPCWALQAWRWLGAAAWLVL
jgi:hypothetical protein